MMNKKQVRQTFRTEVFNRDRFTCRCCGQKGYDRQCGNAHEKFHKGDLKPLDAHHIQNRNLFENGGFTRYNGISLCDVCHLKAEKFHMTNGQEWEKGFHPNDLYLLINSSFEKAQKQDSERL